MSTFSGEDQVPYLQGELRQCVLRQALTEAREIASGYGRTLALTKLAPHVPETLRTDVVNEALTEAEGIKDSERRVRTLIELVSHLEGRLREMVLEEALDGIREIVVAVAVRADMLAELAPFLPERLLAAALSVASETESDQYRAEALVGLAPHLTEALFAEAIAMIRALVRQGKERQASIHRGWSSIGVGEQASVVVEGKEWLIALIDLIPHLPQPEQNQASKEALAAIQVIEYKYPKVWLLNKLVPYLEGQLRQDILGETLELANEIQSAENKASALAILPAHLQGEVREKAVLRDALAAAREVDQEHTRGELLSSLSRHLTRLPCDRLSSLWLEETNGVNLLHLLARRTRRDLLADLRSLVPVIATLGGPEAVVETARAIQDVGRWWP